MTRQRIGLLGGTFDPIHIGHLVIAERAMEQLNLARVIFLPAGLPPHKRDEVHSAAQHRLIMTKLAIGDRLEFSVSDRDIRLDTPSLTVDLLRDMKAENPDANLVFIAGADSLRDFPTWNDPEGIVRLAQLAIADRPDVIVPEDIFDRVRGLREAIVHVETPLLDISATDLRQRIAESLSVRFLIPDVVIAYIERNGLYRHMSNE